MHERASSSHDAQTTGHVVVIGAGPAGLTAAYLLSRAGVRVTVLESDPEYVGGLSRTVRWKGFLFDIGGHRFFSKSAEVEALWNEILPADMLDRPRSSRIYYGGKFYEYPLKAAEALWNLGLLESLLCLLSYCRAHLFPVVSPRNFQDWVSNQFGARLFRIFFRTYTEKVWGMDCREISADWAAQRINGLSLGAAIWQALTPARAAGDRGQNIKSLIHQFRYPRKGPGMMWEAAAREISQRGGQILLGQTVTGVTRNQRANEYTVSVRDQAGRMETLNAAHVISSAPLRALVNGLQPAPPAQVIAAANDLRYRDFITVALIVREKNRFQDNWIYIHDPGVRVGRIQNFKSWSPEMIPDPALCCYGMEYFCFEGDGLWTATDAALIEMATAELETLGLCARADMLDGHVVRQAKAYPVYDDVYAAHVETIRQELETAWPGLHLTGRNGMHKYNNQDHAMMTAMLTVKNILAGRKLYDVWQVNQDAEYHETATPAQPAASGLRAVPARVTRRRVDGRR
ncbi:MAG: NAD(P)/FAD-dependent oxidoreductase [Blastocatellia bacterium]